MNRSLIVGVVMLAACSADVPTETSSAPITVTSPAPAITSAELGDDGCAHVVDVTISDDGGSFTIAATVSSDDQGWGKYADAWQVWDDRGVVLAERVLTHPHEDEQPFTRSQGGIEIPEGLVSVTIAAHDSILGFCGDVYTVEVPGR